MSGSFCVSRRTVLFSSSCLVVRPYDAGRCISLLDADTVCLTFEFDDRL